MNQRRHTSPRVLELALAAVAIAHLGLGVAPTLGQEIQLVGFTDEWRYEQRTTNRPPNWTSHGYDDSDWPSGPGAFGTPFYQNILGIAQVQTRLSEATTGDNITRYFRRRFDFPDATNGVTLISSNLLDDGAIIYLNGLEIGRFGMPTGQVAHSTLPTRSGAVSAHGVDVLRFDPANLVRGDNVLAVELHSIPGQTAFGMSLSAWLPVPITITRQPESLIVSNTRPATLQIEATGFPLYYQWQKDGVNLANQTNATLHIPNTDVTHSGSYRVIVTNAISAATSSVATLTVITDRDGPRLLAAIGKNKFGDGLTFGPNTINVLFDEIVDPSLIGAGVRNPNNYTVTRLGTTHTIPVLSVQYTMALGALLNMEATDPDWIPGDDYVLTVNNVRDPHGNVIAPGSQIAVAWARVSSTNVSLAENVWSFHASAVFDTGVHDEPWQAPDYVEGPWWAQGQGLFYGGSVVQLASCFGAFRTATSFQPEPSLFRTTFLWPADWRTSLQLRLTTIHDDGLVLYLNGTEIYRTNVTAGPLSAVTRASAVSTYCSTNLTIAVTNLRPGTNWLAVAVAQTALTTEGDCIFGLNALSATVTDFIAPSLPESPPPVLGATALGTNSIRLSWSGGGYALESATNINLGTASYHLGPWQQVTNMSNPYTNRMDESQRFFRLKK